MAFRPRLTAGLALQQYPYFYSALPTIPGLTVMDCPFRGSDKLLTTALQCNPITPSTL